MKQGMEVDVLFDTVSDEVNEVGEYLGGMAERGRKAVLTVAIAAAYPVYLWFSHASEHTWIGRIIESYKALSDADPWLAFGLAVLIPALLLVLLTHRYPDMDAISGVYFVNMHLIGESVDAAAREWADYVCRVDRGHTRLDPARPLNPYSVLMIRLSRVGEAAETADEISRLMLNNGLDFVDAMLARVRQGFSLHDPAIVDRLPSLSRDVAAVLADHASYLRDVQHAERFVCALPLNDGTGLASVPGIWIRQPEAELFKSWARGDARAAVRPEGYVFTGVQISAERAILSVAPDSGVTLRGIGDVLEAAEQTKRQRLGHPRTGLVREGFDSPDPWYDGRSALHGYTIVDAPREGTLLSPEEIRRAFDEYLNAIRKRD